jgi:hypothetical protein
MKIPKGYRKLRKGTKILATDKYMGDYEGSNRIHKMERTWVGKRVPIWNGGFGYEIDTIIVRKN